MKKKGWTVFHTNQLNGSYSNFIQYNVAIVGNLDTILNNLGIHEEVIMHVTSSLTSKKYSGQISKISEDKAKKELWSFAIDPRDIDFNYENSFAAAKEKLRQLGDKFSSIEPIKQYGKELLKL